MRGWDIGAETGIESGDFARSAKKNWGVRSADFFDTQLYEGLSAAAATAAGSLRELRMRRLDRVVVTLLCPVRARCCHPRG
jgi:hypothetical protein